MTEEKLDVQESENTEGAENTETTQEVDDKDYKTMFEDQRIRAEKAEKDLKALKGNPPETKEVKEELKTEGVILSPKDYLALTESGVKADEFDRVKELSTLLKKPVFETLKDKTALSILKSEREERETANATATSTKARSSGKSNKELALENFEKGKLPETVEDNEKLAEAQFEQLLNKGK